jgi:hypothetical protein
MSLKKYLGAGISSATGIGLYATEIPYCSPYLKTMATAGLITLGAIIISNNDTE